MPPIIKHPLSEVYKMKSDGPNGGKADMIRGMVHDYRAQARQKLKEEFPSINAQVQTLRLDALNAAVQQRKVNSAPIHQCYTPIG